MIKAISILHCMAGTAVLYAVIQTLFAEQFPVVREYIARKWFYIFNPVILAYGTVRDLLDIPDDKKKAIILDGLRCMMRHDPRFAESVTNYLKRTEP